MRKCKGQEVGTCSECSKNTKVGGRRQGCGEGRELTCVWPTGDCQQNGAYSSLLGI